MVSRRSFLRMAACAAAAVACGTTPETPPVSQGRDRGPPNALSEDGDRVARIAYGRFHSNFADLRVPAGPGPHPVVIVLHGGYWLARYDLEYIAPLAEAITREGFATWNVEYRRLGEAGGGYPGTFEDVARAADHLRTLAAVNRLDLDRVTTVGHSAGGQLAIWLASPMRRRVAPAAEPPRIARVVALAPVTDMRRLGEGGAKPVLDVIGGEGADKMARYAELSPMEIVPLGAPQVVLHGTADGLIPITDSERYVATARAHGDKATLVKLDGLGHVEPVDPRSAAWSPLANALRPGLSSRSAPPPPTA
jgi:acetyl esterase/lipase